MSTLATTNIKNASSASNNIVTAADGTTTISTVKATTELLVGGVSTTANGGTLQISNGITFPATAVACTDANTLDDYEEGTWTPTLGGNATYTAQQGRYTKVGNVVTVQFYLKVNVLGTGSASSISGFPFAATGLSAGSYGGYFSLAVNVIFLAFYISAGATAITNVAQSTSGASVTNGPLIYGNGAEVIGVIAYQVS